MSSDTSPRYAIPFWVEGELEPRLTVNEVVQAADARIGTAIQDRDLATPPASAVEGHLYLVAASATGAWAGEDGNLAQYFNGTWSFYDPVIGWAVWVIDEGIRILWDGSAWQIVSFASSLAFPNLSDGFSLSGQGGKIPVVNSSATAFTPADRPYLVAGFYPGTPGASATLVLHVFTDTATLPADMTSSRGYAKTAPSAQDDFDITKNGSTVATLRFPSSTQAATFICSAAVSFVAGDRLEVVAGASATAADIAFSLRATLAPPT